MARFIFILFLVFSLGCSKPEPVAQTERLKIGMRRAPDSLNPYLATSLEGEIISKRLFPQLFEELPPISPGMPRLQPVLIEKYQWQDDDLVLQLSLKKGLKWSDGQSLSAEDVAFSLGIQINPDIAWVSADRKQRIASWQVKSAHEIEVRFSGKSAFNLLDLNEGVILPKHYFSQWEPKTWLEQAWGTDMVTFGPYRIAEWAASERLVLESIPAGSHPTLGFAFVRDKESLYRLVESGELDYAWGMPVSRIQDLQQLATPVIFPDLTFAFIGWNPLEPGAYAENQPKTPAALNELLQQKPHPVFGDVRVRQALTMAIDRQKHLKDLWRGQGTLPANPWQAGLSYQKPVGKLEPFDLAQAGEVLDQAGWLLQDGVRQKEGKPLAFKVICNSGSPIREAYLLAIKADLEKLGVEMNLAMMEGGLYVQACRERNFDAMFGSFRTGTRPDLGSLYSDEAALGGLNFCTWVGQNERLEAVQQAQNLEALEAAMGELELAFHRDMPLTVLYRGMNIGASSSRELKVLANSIDYLHAVERW